MNHGIWAALLGLGCLSLAVSCASADPDSGVDEGVGAISEGLSKCSGGKIGDGNYCSATCKCDFGEGNCRSPSDCNVDSRLGQLACGGNVQYFHPGAAAANACAPQHCNNRKLDGNETQVDCGGDCGTFCPDPCANLPPNGHPSHCTTQCKCDGGNGGCDENNAECKTGTFCAANVGNYFGFSNVTDMCLANTCTNGVKDSGEQGVDCGPTCLPCSGTPTLSLSKGGSSFERAYDVAIDSAGELTIAGYFGGSVNFGGGALAASGGSDVFVAKYNNVGTLIWSKKFGGTAADGDLHVSVATDSTRAVYVGGNFRGTMDVGGAVLTSLSNSDAFVVKYSATGGLVWAKRYGTTGGSAVTITGMRVAPSGHIYVAGAFASTTVTLGAGTLTNQGPDGTWDGFVMKLNNTGTTAWSRSFGSNLNDQATAIGIDSTSTPYIACSFLGTVEGMTSLGGQEGCLMKLSSTNGATTWARRFGDRFADAATGVAVDANGPVVTGFFANTMTFDDASTVSTTGTYGTFVVGYDPNGTFRWKNAYTSDTGAVRGVSMTGANAGVVAMGDFQGTVAFGATTVAAQGSGRNGWLVRYDTAGNIVYSRTMGNPSALPAGGTVSGGLLGIAGEFRGSIDFGLGSMAAVAQTDIFVARLVY